jgi:hypothetical protein
VADPVMWRSRRKSLLLQRTVDLKGDMPEPAPGRIDISPSPQQVACV